MKKSLRQLVKQQQLMLLFIPFLYFATGIYFRLLLGHPSLRSVDPEYIYFISGLSIAENHFHLGHIDNPGTPLQCLIAIVFRITHFFRGNGTSFIQDVFSEPDLYLSVVNSIITAILSVTLFIGGKYVYKKSGSILYGLLIQTIPLISAIWYQLIGRITPELLIPIVIIMLSMFLVKHLTNDNEDFSYKDIALLSLIMAFGLSIKLTLVPFWIIPVIIIKPWKKKVLSIILSMVFFLIIAYPVTLQIERFWHWIRDLFLFSGQYGDGEKNIIDPEKFRHNLKQIINFEKHFTYLVILSLVLVPGALVWFRNKMNTSIRKKIWFTIALLATILIQVLITGKNYQPRYFIPVVMLGPILFILLFEIVKEFYSHRIVILGINVVLVLFIGWHLKKQSIAINIDSEAIGKHVNARQQSWHFVETMEENAIKIIVSQDYGCPFKEYALLFSTAWADNSLKPYYAQELAQLYPNTYQFTTWDNKFRYWAEELNVEAIIESDTPVYMYLEKKSDDLYNRAIDKINTNGKFIITSEEVFFNTTINEVFYKLSFNKKEKPENDLQ